MLGTPVYLYLVTGYPLTYPPSTITLRLHHDLQHLGLICKYYALPRWVPLSEYATVCDAVGLVDVVTDDWTAAVLPFWPAVIRCALQPSSLMGLLRAGWVSIMGGVTAGLMMTGFSRNLLVFGAFRATKPPVTNVTTPMRGRASSKSPAIKSKAAGAKVAKSDSNFKSTSPSRARAASKSPGRSK